MMTKMQDPPASPRRFSMAKIQEQLNEGSWIEDKNKFGNRSLSTFSTLLAPQSIAVTTVINLPASGERREFVYD